MLLGAKLTNFKKHKDLSVEFTDGMNVIRGPNYAGKSTVLSAIAFALYGIKAIGSEKDELVTTGEKSCKVEVAMVIPSGTEVEVIRTNRDAKVMSGDETIATGNAAVTKWVEDTFGADVKEFLTHTYSRQMETSVLLTAGASDLQKKVENMAKVSIIDKIIKLASKRVTFLSGKLEGINLGEHTSKVLESNVKSWKDKKLTKARELSETSDQLKEDKENLQNVVDELFQVRLINKQITEAVTGLGVVETSEKLNNGSIERDTKLLKSFPEDLDLQVESIKKKESDFLSDHMQNVKLIPKRDALLLKETTTSEWIETVGKPNVVLAEKLSPRIEILENKLLSLESSENFRVEIDVLKLKEKELLKSIEEGVCPTCERAYEDHNPEKLDGQLFGIQQELITAVNNQKKYEEKIEVIRTNLEELYEEYPGDGTDEILSEAVIRLNDIKEKLKDYKGLPSADNLDNAEQKLNTIKESKDELVQAVHDKDKVKTRLQHLFEIRDEYIDKKAALKPMADKEKSDENELIDKEVYFKDHVQKGEYSVSSYTKEYDETEFNLKYFTQQLESQLESEKLYKDTQKTLKLTGDLQKYLRDSRSRFLGSIWGTILARASEIASSTTQGQEDQITEIRRRDNGTFAYVEKGVEFSVRSSSGCQQEIMGVALRLALCDLFYGQSSYLLLDEASSQMNEENSAALAGILAATGKQIIYVTHRMSEQTIAQNVIFVGGEQ